MTHLGILSLSHTAGSGISQLLLLNIQHTLQSNAPLLALDLIGSVKIIRSKILLSVPQTRMQMRDELNPPFLDQEQE